VNKLILKSQSAFMKGRNIMNGVLALHEILHETKRKYEIGVVLKLDFEKTYDKVSWDFLFSCLKLWGFCDTWCHWIKMVVTGGTMCVKLNNKEGPYFVSHKGVRQGDPSPQFCSISLLTASPEWSDKLKEIICYVVWLTTLSLVE